MDFDPTTFFILILTGFFIVWSYRKASQSSKAISDFEYVMFSALWGTLFLAFIGWMDPDVVPILLKNPPATGIALSFTGGIFAAIVGVMLNNAAFERGEQKVKKIFRKVKSVKFSK